VIRHKLNRPQYGKLLFEDVRIMGFLDCKINETCTPETSPMNDEELAERRPGAEIIQRALYSGYLKIHCLKVLTEVFPGLLPTFMALSLPGRTTSDYLTSLGCKSTWWPFNQRLQRLGQMATIYFISPCMEIKSSPTSSASHMHMSLL